ncbi:MAG: Holliday junction resolvase RuvX [candidate division KSB1 bacterium]|nr:Holliday junction resolvase RuvX [candidate division KSB1 bacterium]
MTRDVSFEPKGRILAIDFGSKRVGLAVSDLSQFLATPFMTIENKGYNALVCRIVDIVNRKDIKGIIVGNPLNMDGTVSEMAKRAARLAKKLSIATPVPVFMWDERLTTQSAHDMLIQTGQSPSKQRNRIDQIAAAYLLQSFLDQH